MAKTDAPDESNEKTGTPMLSAACQLTTVGLLAAAQALGPQSLPGKMTSLAYPQTNGKFGMGIDDCYLIAYFVIVFLAARGFLAKYVFIPAAEQLGANGSKFELQAWQFIFYVSAWTWGFVEYCYSDYYLDNTPLFSNFPSDTHTSSFKLYYLVQTAFWVQMVVLTLTEKWEKDFVPMMAHHFITIGLLCCSYFMGYAKVGHVVLVEQDFADILLPLAKMFRYAKWTQCCDATFALFAVAWIPTRHGVFFWIYAHIWNDAIARFKMEGTYGQGYATDTVIYGFLIVLGVFQCLLCFWLKLLLEAIWKTLKGGKTANDIDIATDHGGDDKSNERAKKE